MRARPNLRSLTLPARRGKVLVVFVLVLTCLIGALGLVLDGGLMMASHRTTRNAADSAALAAATELHRGADPATARAAAVAFAQTHNGLADATVTVNIPPAAGPHAGNARYAEVILTRPYNTFYIHVLGVNPAQQVVARAVAGYEPPWFGEGMILLDPGAQPGLRLNGGAQLRVNGSVVVNSRASGLDQYGEPVTTDLPGVPASAAQTGALVTGTNPLQYPFWGRYAQVHGGVDTPGNFHDYDNPVTGPMPLACRGPVVTDPLRLTAVPTPANTPSIADWARKPAVTVGPTQRVTLDPGVYEDITVTGGTVTFNPGVYVLSPTRANQGVTITGGAVTGSGVMFYLTGSNYLDGSPGHWDTVDGHVDGPLPPTRGPYTLPPPADPSFGSVHFARWAVGATPTSSVQLEGMAYDTADPADRTLVFQRRRSTNRATFFGNASASRFGMHGTVYAKWGSVLLMNGGQYNTQFIAGSLEVGTHQPTTVHGTGINRRQANRVYLVE